VLQSTHVSFARFGAEETRKVRHGFASPTPINPLHARFSEAATPAHPPGDAVFSRYAANIRITWMLGE